MFEPNNISFIIVRFFIGFIIFYIMSLDYHDRRKIRNIYWVVMIIFGIIFIELEFIIYSYPLVYHLSILSISFFSLMPLTEIGKLHFSRIRGVFKIPLLLYITLLSLSVIFILMPIYFYSFSNNYIMIINIPILIFIFFILYQIGFIEGGGIAKGLIAISLLFPYWLELFSIIFPFSVWMFVIIFIISIIHLIYNITLNTYRGDTQSPNIFIGIKMNLNEIKSKVNEPISLLEIIEDGKIIPYKNYEIKRMSRSYLMEQLKLFEKRGIEKVWVAKYIHQTGIMFSSFLIIFSLAYGIDLIFI